MYQTLLAATVSGCWRVENRRLARWQVRPCRPLTHHRERQFHDGELWQEPRYRVVKTWRQQHRDELALRASYSAQGALYRTHTFAPQSAQFNVFLCVFTALCNHHYNNF